MLLLFGLLAGIAGCGGNGSQISPPPPPPADFTITAAPASLTLSSAGSSTCTITVAGLNGFAGSVSIAVGAVPTGVSIVPSTFTLSPGGQQKVVLSAVAGAQSASTSVAFTGTEATLSHSASLSITVVAEVSGSHPNGRTQYLHTEETTAGYSSSRPITYDHAHRRFYAANTYLNSIDIFDAIQEIKTGSISVPLPNSVDLSPIDDSLYVANLLGDIYHIDTNTLQIIKRYPDAAIGTGGFGASNAVVLADGRLALLGPLNPFDGGIDGAGSAAVWDPVANTMDTGLYSKCKVSNIGLITASGDRTRVLLGTAVSDNAICSYDPIARQATVGTVGAPSTRFGFRMVATPDGTKFFVGVFEFDAHTLQLVGQIPLLPNYVPNAPNLPNQGTYSVISADGSTIYITELDYGVTYGYDTTTYALKAIIPTFKINDAGASIAIAAIDETGLMFGTIGDHGVAFLDAATPVAAVPSVSSSGSYFITPSGGPLAGGTSIAAYSNKGQLSPAPTVLSMSVGNAAATSVGPGANSYINGVTPASTQATIADVSLRWSDGSFDLYPEAFSYAPYILDVIPNGATADGGQTGAVVGYGFGQSMSGIQVTIGGASAPVTALATSAPYTPYPFPIEVLQFTIPPGVPASAADLSITTTSGTTTAAGAFHYTAKVQSFPTSEALQQGLYDPSRDVYFYTSTNKVNVLSRSGGGWQTPITLPGLTSSSQLMGIAESPNGTLMAVGDFGGGAVYVFSPDTPASARRFAMPVSTNGPGGLAIANSGVVYVKSQPLPTSIPNVDQLYQLDTTTGVFTSLYAASSGENGTARVLLNPDGSQVYTTINGTSIWVSTATGQASISLQTVGVTGDNPDMAMSGDGLNVEANGYLADRNLAAETEQGYVDWETWLPTAVYGQKLNQDGTLMFQPLTDGIDILARDTGRLLYRIQVPGGISKVYDPLLTGSGTNVLGYITSSGVSFADLGSLPIPAQDASPFPNEQIGPTAQSGQSRANMTDQQLRRPSSILASRGRPQLRRPANPALSVR